MLKRTVASSIASQETVICGVIRKGTVTHVPAGVKDGKAYKEFASLTLIVEYGRKTDSVTGLPTDIKTAAIEIKGDMDENGMTPNFEIAMAWTMGRIADEVRDTGSEIWHMDNIVGRKVSAMIRHCKREGAYRKYIPVGGFQFAPDDAIPEFNPEAVRTVDHAEESLDFGKAAQ